MNAGHVRTGQEQYSAAGRRPGGQSSARLVLGARLRRLREAAGVSREDAAHEIRGSVSKLSRLETGRSGIKPRDLQDLLTLYGVGDDGERATALALATPANAGGWWREYGDVVPSWLEHYLELEQTASLIRTYEVEVIPGLLQTEDYARAVVRLGQAEGEGDEEEAERRVALRMSRQRLLYRDEPVRLWAVIDEASLLRPIGGARVMRAQIRHLIEVAELPHVNVQVLPLSAGTRVGTGGCCVLLRFRESELPDVVFLEQRRSALYLTKPADTVPYRDLLDRLVTEARPPAATLTRLLGEFR